MISISDAILLAATKLRSRKIRTIVTAIVAGLLFGALMAILFVFQGASNSLEDFNTVGLGSRYIARATNDTSEYRAATLSDSVAVRAEAIYQQALNDEKAAAKKLGLSRTTESVQKPFFEAYGSGGNSRKVLNIASPAAQKALVEYQVAHPSPGLSELKELAKPYSPIDFYSVNEASPLNGQLNIMKNGAEDFSAAEQFTQLGSQSMDVFQVHPPELVPPQLVKSFLFRDTANHTNYPSAIPLVVSYGDAARLLGMDSLQTAASPNQKSVYIKKLYEKSKNAVFAACYRNDVSLQHINEAIKHQQSKGRVDYRTPDLIYGLPAIDSCGTAKIISDTRTSAQKDTDARQKEFDKMLDKAVEPKQRKIYFRIVGLSPSPPNGRASTVSTLFQDIAGSSLQNGIAIPSDMYQNLPNVAEYEDILGKPRPYLPASGVNEGYYVEFASAEDASRFIQNETCHVMADNTCTSIQKPFILSAFGSNSLGLKSLQEKFLRFFGVTLLVVAAIASIILSGTLGRMIADSRRETAVFRAIGARRIDIAVIYLIYAFVISLLVAAFAFVIGFGGAFAFNSYFSEGMTVQAKMTFGAIDTDKAFHLFSFTPLVWLVCLVVVIVGFISMILPLIRNIRRNPIGDLRDE